MKLCLIWWAAGRNVSDMQRVAGVWTRERSCLRAGQASSSLSQTTPPGPFITLYNTHANDICRRTGNHTDLSLIYGLKDRNKSQPCVSLPSHPYPQSPLIALNQWKSGRYVPLVCCLIACSFTCSVFRISQTASIILTSRWMRTRADRDGSWMGWWILSDHLSVNTIMRSLSLSLCRVEHYGGLRCIQWYTTYLVWMKNKRHCSRETRTVFQLHLSVSRCLCV